VSCGEDLDNAAFDASIRSQLAKAADTYASHVDLGARLKAIREAGRSDQDDDTAVADG
jgi:hypothetical protein